MQIILEQISSLAKFKILDHAIAPRPIAWIVTVNKNGVINLAPYSFFSPVSSEPIVFSICFYHKSNGDLKDTFKNIIEEKKATICVCENKHLKAMHQSAQELDSTTSEAVEFNIKMEVIASDYPPIVNGSRLAFMCNFYDLLEIGKYSKTLLLEAKELFMQDDIYNLSFDFKLDQIGQVGKEYSLDAKFINIRNLK